MTRATHRWRGALAGLALLVALPVCADAPCREAVREQLRDENYILVEEPGGARLLLISPGIDSAVTMGRQPNAGARALAEALEMTRSVGARTRVRGLTLLSGVDDRAALDAALVLLSDPVAAVREEAVQLVIEHPDGDIDSVVAIASRDPSPRVRDASAELIEEHSDDRED